MHSNTTLTLKNCLDNNPELMAMMEESIKKAAIINPDRKTNPVNNVEELYSFIDWNMTALPWNLLTDAKYSALYNHLDQGVDYLWFLFDQPLNELRGRGYYYPTLQYHEPISAWLRNYSIQWGEFLSREESWNDEFYEMIINDPCMNMRSEWYGDINIWKTFNEWFSRKLVNLATRPIGDSEVLSPADSTPQGVWDIDDYGYFIQKDGINIKSGNFTSVAMLIGSDSRYKDVFKGGILTHTLLDVSDYHRYHFPVSGTIKELRKIKGTNGAGGITVWDNKNKKYVLNSGTPGWQMIETRDCAIIDTEDYGIVAILPIGMSQICSCNWEDSIKEGIKVKKGDSMGYFLFGGSDIVMIFQSDLKAEFLCPKKKDGNGYEHILMGENYMKLTRKRQK